MRIAKPHEDILQHCDDIDAAFRRIIYHPDLAVTFAYVFSKFLNVPVGQVVGICSSPSYFSLISDIRSYTVSTQDLVVPNEILKTLAMTASITPLPSTCNQATDLTPAIEDTAHAQFSAAELENFVTAMFVDDYAVSEYRDDMQVAIHQIV